MTKRQKKTKSHPKKGARTQGFGNDKQQPSLIKPKAQRSKSTQATCKTWEPLQIKSKKLRKMYETGEGAHKYPPSVVDNFFDKMQLLDMANNKHDLERFPSLGFHQLKGKRKEQYAVWLTGNWRLTMIIKEDAESKYLLILKIVDYH